LIDDTFCAAHGAQQLAFWNAHHDERGFASMHIYHVTSGTPVVAILRAARTPKGTEVRTVIKHVTKRLRTHWPNTRIVWRGDSHYGRANQTLRQMVHTSIGGTKVRVLISNAYGSAPVTIGAGHIALREKGGSIQGASGGTLTFSGRATMTVPAGATVYSDPVNLTVPAMADLAVDLYLPGDTSAATMLTMHNGAFQTNYISETGNYVGQTTLPNAANNSELVPAVARRGGSV
jgi:hypothetical protein